jgi:hypothetical protein
VQHHFDDSGRLAEVAQGAARRRFQVDAPAHLLERRLAPGGARQQVLVDLGVEGREQRERMAGERGDTMSEEAI